MQAKLIAVGRVSPTIGWSMRSHQHRQFHEIIVPLQGRMQVQIRGQLLIAGPGEALLYPIGDEHEEMALGEGPLETIFVCWNGVGSSIGNWPLKVACQHGRLEYLGRWLLDMWHMPRPGTQTLLNHLVNVLLHVYKDSACTEENDLVTRMRRFAQSRLAQALRLDDLAAEAGLSRYHFIRLFHQLAGQTPMRFLRGLRVETAKTLLQTTPLPLHSIAAQVGFADEYHLSRVFFEVTRQRPSSVRSFPRSRP